MAVDTTSTDYSNFLELNTYTQTSTTLSTSVTTVTAVPLVSAVNSADLLVVGFSIQAASSNSGNVHIGGYNVTSSVAGIILDAGQRYDSPQIQFINDMGTSKYDLNRIYMAADGTSAQKAFITVIVRRRDSNNPTA